MPVSKVKGGRGQHDSARSVYVPSTIAAGCSAISYARALYLMILRSRASLYQETMVRSRQPAQANSRLVDGLGDGFQDLKGSCRTELVPGLQVNVPHKGGRVTHKRQKSQRHQRCSKRACPSSSHASKSLHKNMKRHTTDSPSDTDFRRNSDP